MTNFTACIVYFAQEPANLREFIDTHAYTQARQCIEPTLTAIPNQGAKNGARRKQDAKDAAFPMRVYIDVHEQGKTHSATPHCAHTYRNTQPKCKNGARRKQDAKDAAFPMGMYIDVHEQGKTQVRQSIAQRISLQPNQGAKTEQDASKTRRASISAGSVHRRT